METTINTFDKYASQYMDKFINYEPYIETYRNLSSLLKVDYEILDVACGPGNISKFLLDQNPQLRVHGIDLSPQMVNLAKSNNPTATFEIMDGREISSFNKKYDVIVAGFYLPYLSKEETSQFIVNARKIIKTGGIIYISTMEGEYEDSGYQSKNNKDRVFIYYHQAKYLLEELKSVGFDIINYERKPFELDEESKTVDLFIYARAC